MIPARMENSQLVWRPEVPAFASETQQLICYCRGIYAECAKILWEEVDYINEGRNADRFRRNFASEDWVRVPRIHWRQTTPVVLTLEYMPGLKVTDKKGLLNAGLNPVDIAKTATEAYLLQILRYLLDAFPCMQWLTCCSS